jgi:hypothetical protein
MSVTICETVHECRYTNLTVEVRKQGAPVNGANVIAVSKALPTLWKPIPDYYVGKTGADGKAYFSVNSGTYLILADDGADYRAYMDNVTIGTAMRYITLYLTEKKEARYYVKLTLSVDAGPYLAPVVNALGFLVDKFIEITSWITAPLGIAIPGSELARHFEIESVEGVGREITIWIKYIGSPVPQAVIIALIYLAIVIVIFVVAPIVIAVVTKWAFGESAPAIAGIWGVALAAIAGASIIGGIAYLLGKRH